MCLAMKLLTVKPLEAGTGPAIITGRHLRFLPQSLRGPTARPALVKQHRPQARPILLQEEPRFVPEDREAQSPRRLQAREPDWNRGEAMKPVPEVRELLTIPAMALLPEGIQCPETIRHQGQGWIREPALPRQGREVPEVRRALRLCLRKIMRTLARECNPEFLQKFCCRKIKRML